MGTLHFGVAGWSYADWKGIVYPEPRPRGFDELAFLAPFFDVLEVNSSFYRPPSEKTAASWVRRTEGRPGFLFTLKVHRRFTHEPDARWEPDEAETFRRGIGPIREAGRLGALLLQFPGSCRNIEPNRKRLSALAAAFLLWQGLQPCDDAYITFRHARNLAAHLRPAWHLAGEPVMGSTAPAFVLLLGLPGFLAGGAHVEAVALGVNAVLHGVVVLLTYLVVFDLLRRSLPALLAAALVAANSINVFVFSLGFENAMLTATLLGSLWAARRGRPGIALMLASLAPLVRPEGLLVTPLVWAHVVLARRFRPAHVACFLLLPLRQP